MSQNKNLAQALYGTRTKKEQEEKDERNLLLNDLGDKLNPAQVLYSPIEELRKMKQMSEESVTEYKSRLEDKGKFMTSLRKEEEKDERFQEFLKEVYKLEGGFSDNKNDRGGRTNFGITQGTYDLYNKKHKLPLKDVKNITKEESDKIYYHDFYVASGADKIKDKNLSFMHFDSAVNNGIGNAKKFYKESGNDIEKYYNARLNHYNNLAKNPTQKEFHKGWINRLNRVKNYQS